MKRRWLGSLALLALLAGACTRNGEASPGERESAPAATSEEITELTKAVKALGVQLSRVEGRVVRIEQNQNEVLTAIEFLAVDMDAVKRNTWDMLQAAQVREGREEPPAPEDYQRLFEPETRAALVAAAAEKGVTLLEDRVLVPGVIVQKQAPLEFLVVVTGGKEHEAVVALTGNKEYGAGRPTGLAGMLNACLLALGYERGKPVRQSTDGKILPPEGEPIYLYVEWEEDGERVRVRGEDLVYNLVTERAMDREPWVYVGSRFERDYATGEVVYVPDHSGDVASTWSWPYTIIDNTTSEGADDIYYSTYSTRIPEPGKKVTMVFSRVRLPAKEFPAKEGGPPDDGGSDD